MIDLLDRSGRTCEAVRLACGRIARDELESLREGLRASFGAEADHPAVGVTEARALDSRLHDVVACGSGNAFLVNELGRLSILFRAFRDAAWMYTERRNDYHRLGAEASEHLAIVEALLAEDRQGAMSAMARHIASGVDYWTRALPDDATPAELEEDWT